MRRANPAAAEPERSDMLQQKIRGDRIRPAGRFRSSYFGFALVGAASAGFASAGLAAAAFAAASCIMAHQAVGSGNGFLADCPPASAGPGCMAFIAASVFLCISSPWIDRRSMLRFRLSQFSTDFRSVIFFSTASMSSVGATIPGMGNPMGFHSFFMNSNGSGSGSDMAAPRYAMGNSEFNPNSLTYAQKLQHRVTLGECVPIAKIDEGAAKGLLEQQVARQVGTVAVHRADAAQHEFQHPGQFLHVPAGDALDRLARRNYQHLDRAQVHPGLEALVL